jgi:hypothetical protein
VGEFIGKVVHYPGAPLAAAQQSTRALRNYVTKLSF